MKKTSNVTASTRAIKTAFWNSGIVLVGEGEFFGEAEGVEVAGCVDEVGETVGGGEGVWGCGDGVGEESGAAVEKLWKTKVAGLAVPS